MKSHTVACKSPCAPKMTSEVQFDAKHQNLMSDIKFWRHRCVHPLTLVVNSNCESRIPSLHLTLALWKKSAIQDLADCVRRSHEEEPTKPGAEKTLPDFRISHKFFKCKTSMAHWGFLSDQWCRKITRYSAVVVTQPYFLHIVKISALCTPPSLTNVHFIGKWKGIGKIFPITFISLTFDPNHVMRNAGKKRF